MTYTLGGTTLNGTKSENVRYYSKADLTPQPDSGSSSSYVIDNNGVLRSILVDGELSDTVANIRTFITAMRNLHTGTQYANAAFTFHDDLMNEDVNVFVEAFEYTYKNDYVNILTYSLQLYERVPASE
jgi:hypothetical protein